MYDAYSAHKSVPWSQYLRHRIFPFCLPGGVTAVCQICDTAQNQAFKKAAREEQMVFELASLHAERDKVPKCSRRDMLLRVKRCDQRTKVIPWRQS